MCIKKETPPFLRPALQEESDVLVPSLQQGAGPQGGPLCTTDRDSEETSDVHAGLGWFGVRIRSYPFLFNVTSLQTQVLREVL